MGQEPDAIRQDIAQTRTELGETVEAVGYKADVPSRAKEAVSDKVENMKSKVSTRHPSQEAVVGTGSRAGDATGQGQVKRAGRRAAGMAKENPLGLAIGAAALGFLAGLAVPRPGSRTRSSAGCPIRSWTRSKRPARRPGPGQAGRPGGSPRRPPRPPRRRPRSTARSWPTAPPRTPKTWAPRQARPAGHKPAMPGHAGRVSLPSREHPVDPG